MRSVEEFNGTSASPATLSRVLADYGITRKKIQSASSKATFKPQFMATIILYLNF